MTKKGFVELYEKVLMGPVNFNQIIIDEKIDLIELNDSLLEIISGTIDKNDGDFIEAALSLFSFIQKPSNWTEILCQLLLNENHHSHEDIISQLQDIRDEQCIPYIIKAIDLKPRLDYLSYDNYGAFFKKCLWVFAALGTSEAKKSITYYTNSNIPELRREAIERLKHFEGNADWAQNH